MNTGKTNKVYENPIWNKVYNEDWDWEIDEEESQKGRKRRRKKKKNGGEERLRRRSKKRKFHTWNFLSHNAQQKTGTER